MNRSILPIIRAFVVLVFLIANAIPRPATRAWGRFTPAVWAIAPVVRGVLVAETVALVKTAGEASLKSCCGDSGVQIPSPRRDVGQIPDTVHTLQNTLARLAPSLRTAPVQRN